MSLARDEQNEIVTTLAVEVETLTEEEFDDLYEQLDAEHKAEVMDNLREFAANAIGDEHWDTDA